MSKTLKTLIRLKKDDVDKLQKELSQIQERQQRLHDEYNNLEAELIREEEAATNFPEAMHGYAMFAKRTMDRQKILLNNIRMLQQAIDKKRDELLVEYGEQKKFEIALEQRQLAALNEAKRLESIKMDEVAARSFARKE